MSANKAVAEEYMRRVWQERDFSAIEELLYYDVVIDSPLGSYYGPGAMKRVVQMWLDAFPDLKVINDAVIAEGDLVVIRWSAHGTHQGLFKGYRSTHKSVRFPGVTICKISEGKIVEYWAYLDVDHILNQIR